MAGRGAHAVAQGRRGDDARGLAGEAGVGGVRLPGGPADAVSGRATSTFGWCPVAPRAVSIRFVHNRLQALRGARGRHGGRKGPTRLHGLAFVAGLGILAAGIAGWALTGGPASFEEFAVVLDLTIGGTILATGALVGPGASVRDAPRRAAGRAPARGPADERQPVAARRSAARSSRRRAASSTTTTPGSTSSIRPTTSCRSRSRAASAPTSRSTSRSCRRSSARGSRAGSRCTASRCASTTRPTDPRGETIPGTDDVDESMLIVPMQHDEKLIGVITLSKLGLRQFDDEDLRLLTILADQAGTAFSGAANLAETRRLASELRQLLDMNSALSRSLDPRAVADLMAEHVARAVGADRAQISDWDRPNGRLRTLGCFPTSARADMDDYYPLEGYPLTCQVLEGGVIETVDVEDPDADPAEAELLRRDGMRGLVMLPLIAKGQAIGLIELVSVGPPTTESGRITLATTMAHEAAMALENARLYETRAQPRRPRPADRLLQPPLPARAAGRGGRARGADPPAVERRDARPRRLQARQRQLRPPVRRRRAGPRRGADPVVAARVRRPGPLRGRRVRADPARDHRARTRHSVAARMLAAFRDSPFSSDGRVPFPIGASIGIATYPQDGRSATDLLAVADRGLYDAKAAGGNRVGPDVEAVDEAPIELGAHRRRTGEPMARGRPRGGPAGRSSAVEWGLSQYGSTRTPAPTVRCAALARARAGRMLGAGEPPEPRLWRPRAAHGTA